MSLLRPHGAMKAVENPQARIAYLEKQLETLQDKYDHLLAGMGQKLRFPSAFKLTKHQEIVLGVIFTRQIAYISMIDAAMYAHKPIEIETPPHQLIKVFIYHIRKRLKPFGLSIKTNFAVGYSMSPKDKLIIRNMIDAEAAAEARLWRGAAA